MKTLKLVILAIPLLCACGRFDTKESDAPKQKRVVCIAKQYTEIIFALGAQQELVAVDISSTFPEEAKKLTTVGYHRALSLEAIMAAKPDLIIHDNNIGPEHVVTQLEKLNVPMKVFGHYGNTIAGTDSLIREMGAYFDRSRQADSLCAMLDADMKHVFSDTLNDMEKPKVCIVHYGQASNVYLTMTSKSNAARMVNWAGGKLELSGEKGMMPLSAEVIAKSDPDVILLTDFGYDRLGGNMDKIKELPGIGDTKAARNNRIFRIEEHDLVYLGPRTGKNVRLIRDLIHTHAATAKK